MQRSLTRELTSRLASDAALSESPLPQACQWEKADPALPQRQSGGGRWRSGAVRGAQARKSG